MRLRSLSFHIDMHYVKMDIQVLATPGSLCYDYHITKTASTNRQSNLTFSMFKISFNHFSLSQVILDDISHKGCLRLGGFLQAMHKKLICSVKKDCFVNIFKQLLSQKSFYIHLLLSRDWKLSSCQECFLFSRIKIFQVWQC